MSELFHIQRYVGLLLNYLNAFVWLIPFLFVLSFKSSLAVALSILVHGLCSPFNTINSHEQHWSFYLPVFFAYSLTCYE